MSQQFLGVDVIVNPPPRGPGSQTPGTFQASMVGTFAWGIAPGTATLSYIGDAPVTTGSEIRIQIGSHFFCGICLSDTEDKSALGGMTRTLQFADFRYYLTSDYIACAFNKLESRILVGGYRVKRYRHLYPQNYNAWAWTYTNSPLFAWQILAAILNFRALGLPAALTDGTIGTPWSWDLTGLGQFPGGVLNMPLYDFDCLGARRLDSALAEISERSGAVMAHLPTEAALYRQVWTIKGYGSVPEHLLTDGEKLGSALSGHPTNVRILGGRNLYQVMDLTLVKDWSTAWEQFLVFELFADDIYHRGVDPVTGIAFASTPNDPDQYVGRQLATARALEITVDEYVQLTGNAAFADYRKFAGRSRMNMPAALYIQQLLFRAFRPNFSFLTNIYGKNVPIESLDIVDQLLCRVFHSPLNGTMTFNVSEPVEGNGYAIVKGYQVGPDLFKAIKPEQMRVDFFAATTRAWGVASFQIDDSGEGVRFVIFDQPVIVSNDLLVDVNGFKVINAAFTIQVPAVKASLVFAAEPFSYWRGTYPNYSRDTVVNVPNLIGEYVVQGGGFTEIAYGDGYTAAFKAIEIGDAMLVRQYSYLDGGRKNIWDGESPIEAFGTQLNSMIDRVQIRVAPMEGVAEQIDFTNERARDNFEPERDLERRSVQNSLFPGQTALRQQSETAQKVAEGFRQMPFAAKLLSRMLTGNLGGDDPLHLVWISGGVGLLAVGTPMLKVPNTTNVGAISTDTLVLHPSAVTSASNVFAGVTVRNNENSAKPFFIQNTGLAVARVQGPINENDPIGIAAPSGDNTFFVKDGTPSVGRALQKVVGSGIQLIRVQLGAGGGGGASPPIWLP